MTKTVLGQPNIKVLCQCPNAKPGIVAVNPLMQKPECRFRRRAASEEFTEVSYLPSESGINEYRLGVAIGGEV